MANPAQTIQAIELILPIQLPKQILNKPKTARAFGFSRGAFFGFTLIEVLVALVIVAISLGAATRLGDGQLGAMQRAKEQFFAQICAQNRLIQIRLERQFLDIGQQSTICQQAGEEFTVLLRVQGTPNPSFRRVELEVSARGEASFLPQETPLLQMSALVSRY